ncbi:DUF3883 domain-containing protein [Prevotella sp. Rep29]|uniref:DUF3883 domain-containing protein n=1 Tax=Prevotella sp. Rep29 TaxID=2691580 RepID=UPI001C6E9ABE|nr:DUF3883 domain-containing protein [Prevotella sp. Rep29]QYR10926.1 DUF3883 domain-containing protein [Prevotella sp. Rep29]
MNKELLILRESLIAEAKNSPMLLSDLAGLEAYVSESYNSRSFIELLQNADNAKATKFCVKRFGDYLFVANNGRPFNIKDVESLCRSASSNKVRGTSIGYRGIGFKSVVSFAKEVHLVSGDFEITFSKELSKKLIPQAPKVPLIRIPHEMDDSVKNELANEIKAIQEEGFKTIYIFSSVLANQIDEEYTSFASTTILFLNSIQVIKILLNKKVTANIAVVDENEKGRFLRVSTTDAISNWFVCSDSNCSIAFSMNNGKVTRLPKNEAIIHAFLPTEDSCGLGIVVNGDFSTDPSRRHLIMDETTVTVISNLAKLYASLLKYALSNKDKHIIDALMPYFDLKLIQLMKQSFEKEFAKKIKEAFGKELSNLKLSPSWLNAEDFAKIMAASNLPYIAPECSEIYGLHDFLKYLGNKAEDVGALLSKVNNTEISVLGYAQLVAAGIREVLMNHKLASLGTTDLVISNGRLCSFKEVNENEEEIDESYVQLLLDNGVSENDISQFLKKMGLSNINEVQFSDDDEDDYTFNDEEDEDDMSAPSSVSQWYNDASSSSRPAVYNEGVQKWRSAEENTLAALNANGFRLKDVSKQNLGFDLEGSDPNGKNIYIEVKSIDYVGQKFRMTNNEFAAAQYKPDCYYLALVFQNNDSFEISLIRDPINRLNMTRQVVQWVWECSDYEYKPIKFSL